MKIDAGLKKDFFSGFIVSLIALPLGLGLALASNVPPTAGLIAAIVGGVVVSIFGGSHVTITGPGNGLVVVILTAVTALGNGDPFTGYLAALGAIVVSGGVMSLLGFLKFGKLGDIFPSSAIQGMLSAIGIIILAKQAHIMLGNLDPKASSNAEMLYTLPATVFRLFSETHWQVPALVGLASLGIMIFYSKIRKPIFQLIPAPMWVLLLCIGFYEYFRIFKLDYPIQPEYLLQLPNDLSQALVFPDFSRIGEGVFWEAVIGITLISTVESLLSIKAVDRLDPQARRSNVNKDLKALGLGTMLSGLVGGLPVVTVIARSSVNVNTGANSRKANFFHGILLLTLVLTMQSVLKKIPMPALCAILVYTGYKLAEPAIFRRMWRAGWQQFAIFLLTIVITLFFGLINGILVGILATLVQQMLKIHPLRLFFRYLIWPNTLMYEESENQFIISVKGVSNFLNFPRLKEKLESLPIESRVILDFSLTKYMDSTVLEHIQQFESERERRGGELEVIGLDDLAGNRGKPLSLVGSRSLINPLNSMSKRQAEVQAVAEELNWNFKVNPTQAVHSLEKFPYFRTKRIEHAFNTLLGETELCKIKVRDVEYFEGEFIAKEMIRSTMAVVNLDQKIPAFTIHRENLLSRIAAAAGFEDLEIPDYPDFNKRFYLRGNSEELLEFFDHDLVLFLESRAQFHIESVGNKILVFDRERLATVSELKALIRFTIDLVPLLLERGKSNP